MTVVSEAIAEPPPEQDEHACSAAEDLTGRERMAHNVLVSWGGHIVYIVAGFIMPRLIDRHIGQSALGVWDFGWSLVSYFGMAQVGIGSSVNRYVARYRAAHDTTSLNRAVSSVMCIQILAGIMVTVLTLLATWLLPVLFKSRLAGQIEEARWVVLFLGAGLAVQMFLNVYVGVLTGCHRWDLHNGISAGFYALTVVGMIVALVLGGGLKCLAMASFVGMMLTEITRAAFSYRVCPELRIRLRSVRWAQTLEMLTFGGKSALDSVSRLLLYQTNGMLIVGYLGPGALAVFSRPKALVSHAQRLVNKFGFVLTPTASSLQADGRHAELQRLLAQAGRFALAMALPMVLFLSIMGDPLLKLWMGPRYEQGMVLAVLALGHMTEMIRQPILNIITGLNAHGTLGAANLVSAILSVVLGFAMLGILHWGLMGAAIALVMPLVLVNGTFVPIYACRMVGLPLRRLPLRIISDSSVAGHPLRPLPARCTVLAWQDRRRVPACRARCGGSRVVSPLLALCNAEQNARTYCGMAEAGSWPTYPRRTSLMKKQPITIVQYWGGCPQTPDSKWQQFLDCLRACANKGWRTCLVWSDMPRDPLLSRPFEEAGCKIVLHSRAHGNFDLQCIRRTYCLLRKINCDVFHCHNVHTSPLIGAALAKVPVRIWSKLAMSPYYEQGVAPTGIHRLALSTRLSCNLAHRILAVSHPVRDELISCGASSSRVLVWPTPIDIESFSNSWRWRDSR